MQRIYDKTSTCVGVVTDEEQARRFADRLKASAAKPKAISTFTAQRLLKEHAAALEEEHEEAT